MMSNFSRDLWFAARAFRATPGFALLAIAILAIGVAAVAVQTAIVRGVLMAPLPFKGAPKIHALYWRDRDLQPAGPFSGLPLNDLPVWQATQRTFHSTTAFGSAWAAIVQNGPQAKRFTGCYVQGNFFTFLGVKPLLGRTISLDDNQPGVAPNVVLSYSFWRNEFGGQLDVVGRTFPLNGKVATVVGVMGREFSFPMNEDLWIPLYTQYAPREQGNAYSPFVRVLGRLAPGVPLRTALAELERDAVDTAQKFPSSNGRFIRAVIEPLRSAFLAPAVRRMIWLLAGAVTAVMAFACVNVMNMLLSRAAQRNQELAVRVALGAPPGALFRRGLADATVLAAAAIFVGNVFAVISLPRVWVWTQSTEFRLPPWMEFALDWRAMAASSLFSGACVLIAAVAPGMILARLPVADALKAAGRTVSNRLAGRIASLFVALQVSLTVVLLVWTSLIVRSVHNQLADEWGYDLASVLSARVGLFPSSYGTVEARTAVTEKVLQELRTIPEVSHATVTDRFRMTLVSSTGLSTDKDAAADESTWPQVWVEAITENYFATLRVPLVQGREFDYEEQWRNRPTVIVNRSFARRFFPGRNLIGETIQLQGHPPRTVIGVAPDTLMQGPGNTSADGAGVFVPWTSSVTAAGTLFPTLVVRGTVRPERLERPLREAVARVDPSLATYFVGTPKALVTEYLAAGRVLTWLLQAFTAVALVLAASGVFGLVSTSVSGRLREFAIRLALGAGATAIARAVLWRNARELALGLGWGVVVSIASTSLFAGPLYRVSIFDPLYYATALILIVVVSLVASVAPIWRALKADPVNAMRDQ